MADFVVVVGVVVVERGGDVAADSDPRDRLTAVELKLKSPASPTMVPAITICARFTGSVLVVSSCAVLPVLEGERLLVDSVASGTESQERLGDVSAEARGSTDVDVTVAYVAQEFS